MPEINNLSSSEYSISNIDLNLFYCGEEDCESDHFWGPSVRDHYLIHYIVRGKGIFQYDGKVYELSQGQGFLISPYKLSFYQADHDNPWHYKWVGFKGLNAHTYLDRANLSVQQPIFNNDSDSKLEDCIDSMINALTLQKSRDLMYKGLLYEFLSILIESSTGDKALESAAMNTEQYVRKAMEFVNMNYSRKTSIDEMAQFVGLNRKYLSKIFKSVTNITPQEFLINYRINKACELMEDHTLPISNIAHSVGYDDPLHFSKIFKKVKQISPREFEKQLIKTKSCT